MSTAPDDPPAWRRCTVADAEVLAEMNAQLSRDEGAAPVGTLSDYLARMRARLEEDRYQAAVAESASEAVAYTSTYGVMCSGSRAHPPHQNDSATGPRPAGFVTAHPACTTSGAVASPRPAARRGQTGCRPRRAAP